MGGPGAGGRARRGGARDRSCTSRRSGAHARRPCTPPRTRAHGPRYARAWRGVHRLEWGGRAGPSRRERVDAVRVLVTGARGMLGRAVALALAARGDDVTVLQRQPSGLPVREVLADLGDPDAPLTRRSPGRTPSCTSPRKSTWSGRGGSTHGRTSTAPGACSPLRGLPEWPGSCTCRRRRWRTRATPWSAREPARRTPAEPAATTPAARRWPSRRCWRTSARVTTPPTNRRTGTRNSPNRKTQLAEQARATRRAETRNSPAVVVVRPHLVWGPGDTQLVGRILARARAGRLRRGRHRYRADRHHVRRRRGRRARRRPRPGDRPARAGAGRLRRRAAARRRAAGVDLRRCRRPGPPQSPCRPGSPASRVPSRRRSGGTSRR